MIQTWTALACAGMIFIGATSSHTAAAQSAAELNKDPAVLGLHLGMSQGDIRNWFASNKTEYPNPQIKSLTIQMSGGLKYDGAISVVSKTGKTEESFLFQFSPPFDGNVLVGIVRNANYGLDAGNGPQARDLEKLLYERYGMYPSSTFIGHNLFWASKSSLTEEQELMRCTYTNNISVQSLLNGNKGCGTTLDVELTNNSSHTGTVMIFQTALWDQDRIVANLEKAASLAEAGAAAQAGKPAPAPGPKL
jgi:hypothetical protein